MLGEHLTVFPELQRHANVLLKQTKLLSTTTTAKPLGKAKISYSNPVVHPLCPSIRKWPTQPFFEFLGLGKKWPVFSCDCTVICHIMLHLKGIRPHRSTQGGTKLQHDPQFHLKHNLPLCRRNWCPCFGTAKRSSPGDKADITVRQTGGVLRWPKVRCLLLPFLNRNLNPGKAFLLTKYKQAYKVLHMY